MPELQIALVVIARNEAARLPRLLSSTMPWVDRALVLDTGSTDATIDVARAHGAQVESFAWCDDFSAARNVALEHAAADWHIVLDADEWLLDGGPVLQALRRQSPLFVGAIELVDSDGHAQVTDWLSRILPRQVRYSGRVHEQPQHRWPVNRLPIRVGHDGYLPERLKEKQGRNRALLLAELMQAPDDAYLWYQLGKDQAAYEEHGAAAESFERAEALGVRALWRYDLSARTLFAMKKTGRHAEAILYAQARLVSHGESPDFFFALGDVLLDWAAEQPQRALELLPMARAAWQRCLEIGERPDLPGAVSGRGGFLAAHNLAVLEQGWPLNTP